MVVLRGRKEANKFKDSEDSCDEEVNIEEVHSPPPEHKKSSKHGRRNHIKLNQNKTTESFVDPKSIYSKHITSKIKPKSVNQKSQISITNSQNETSSNIFLSKNLSSQESEFSPTQDVSSQAEKSTNAPYLHLPKKRDPFDVLLEKQRKKKEKDVEVELIKHKIRKCSVSIENINNISYNRNSCSPPKIPKIEVPPLQEITGNCQNEIDGDEIIRRAIQKSKNNDCNTEDIDYKNNFTNENYNFNTNPKVERKAYGAKTKKSTIQSSARSHHKLETIPSWLKEEIGFESFEEKDDKNGPFQYQNKRRAKEAVTLVKEKSNSAKAFSRESKNTLSYEDDDEVNDEEKEEETNKENKPEERPVFIRTESGAELSEDMIEIVESAYKVDSNQFLISKFHFNFAYGQIKTFRGDEWLDDNNVDFYLEMINERSKIDSSLPQIYVYHSFFYKLYAENGYEAVRGTTSNHDIFSHELAFIPMVNSDHWILIVINFKAKTVKSYDSLKHNNNRHLKLISKYLRQEYRCKILKLPLVSSPPSKSKKETSLKDTSRSPSHTSSVSRSRSREVCSPQEEIISSYQAPSKKIANKNKKTDHKSRNGRKMTEDDEDDSHSLQPSQNSTQIKKHYSKIINKKEHKAKKILNSKYYTCVEESELEDEDEDLLPLDIIDSKIPPSKVAAQIQAEADKLIKAKKVDKIKKEDKDDEISIHSNLTHEKASSSREDVKKYKFFKSKRAKRVGEKIENDPDENIVKNTSLKSKSASKVNKDDGKELEEDLRGRRTKGVKKVKSDDISNSRSRSITPGENDDGTINSEINNNSSSSKNRKSSSSSDSSHKGNSLVMSRDSSDEKAQSPKDEISSNKTRKRSYGSINEKGDHVEVDALKIVECQKLKRKSVSPTHNEAKSDTNYEDSEYESLSIDDKNNLKKSKSLEQTTNNKEVKNIIKKDTVRSARRMAKLHTPFLTESLIEEVRSDDRDVCNNINLEGGFFHSDDEENEKEGEEDIAENSQTQLNISTSPPRIELEINEEVCDDSLSKFKEIEENHIVEDSDDEELTQKTEFSDSDQSVYVYEDKNIVDEEKSVLILNSCIDPDAHIPTETEEEEDDEKMSSKNIDIEPTIVVDDRSSQCETDEDKEESISKSSLPSCEEFFKDWSIYSYDFKEIPQQDNGSDCGIFICQFAECLSRRVEPPFDFTQANMPYFRYMMTYETIEGKLLPRKRIAKDVLKSTLNSQNI